MIKLYVCPADGRAERRPRKVNVTPLIINFVYTYINKNILQVVSIMIAPFL